MEKFINDIKTFFYEMQSFTKIAIVALLSILLVLAFAKFIKTISKDKAKFSLGQILLIAILAGLLILISIWSF